MGAFVVVYQEIIRARAGIIGFLAHDSFFHCVGIAELSCGSG